MIICDNLGDHIVGNVYVKFTKEEYTGNALKALHGRYYAGKLILPEFSPVVDFRESRYKHISKFIILKIFKIYHMYNEIIFWIKCLVNLILKTSLQF